MRQFFQKIGHISAPPAGGALSTLLNHQSIEDTVAMTFGDSQSVCIGIDVDRQNSADQGADRCKRVSHFSHVMSTLRLATLVNSWRPCTLTIPPRSSKT